MKSETEKKDRIRRYYNKYCSRLSAFILLLTLIGVFFITIFIEVNIAFDGFNKIYSGYPEQEYVKLEEEFDRIIVDNQYIDMERLSDKDIEYTETLIKSNGYPEKTWEITLEKDDIELYSTIAKTEDNTLKALSKRGVTKSDFYALRTLGFIGLIILCIIISMLIWVPIVVCYIFIEYKVEASKSMSNSVSNSKTDNS